MVKLENVPKFVQPIVASVLRMPPQATPRAQLLAKLQKQQEKSKEQQRLAELDATTALETPTIESRINSDGA